MAAYAALLVLARSLREILDLEERIDPLHKQKIVPLHEKVDFIVSFLEDYSDKYHLTLGGAGNGIRKAAYEAQDFMDSYLSVISTITDDWSYAESSFDKLKLDRDLTMAFERIGFIWEESMKMKNSSSDKENEFRSRPYSFPDDAAKNMLVGLDCDLNSIKEQLHGDSCKLQIIPIFGMGGIGKTTLARRVYDDSLLSQSFDICAWITVSQEFQRRELLSRLLQSLKNEQSNESEAQLAKLVYQNLLGRRYLIVVDDVWSTKAWDDLKMIYPDDGSGSRILLTTRIWDVAAQLGSSDTPIHRINFLNEDQSWKLLKERVFGQQSCPLQLVEIGKKIAKSCGGLPLTVVVVAGLLLSMDNLMNEETWENVAENISSREPIIALQCSKILCFSYDQLPLRLKPCFLYIAVFPEDSEICVPKLINLWVAEGFLKPNDQFKCLEDAGERYLEDLVNRSLLLVSKKGPDGKLETVGIHDMLREICITKAEEEGFLHHVSPKTDSRTEFIENPHRRLAIHCTKNFQEWNVLDSSVRSILLFSRSYEMPRLQICSRHIGIFEARSITWLQLSRLTSRFVNLRYFAFAFNIKKCPDGLPVSISKHPNLQTIDVRVDPLVSYSQLQVPYEILQTPKLRHLIWDYPFCLSYPTPDVGIVHKSDLQTIETVVDFIFAQEIIKVLVNLKKLKVEYYNTENLDWDAYNLDNLCHLQNLENLEINMVALHDPSLTWNFAFPTGLKKLYLYGVPLPWENMTIVGSLPNLLVLEMMAIEVDVVSEWTTEEGQFVQLKYFRSSLDYVAKWETEKEHFPCLETLILEGARWMTEIPSGVGEIDTLQYILLKRCKNSLVDSAKQIQQDQHENGNDAFRVCVIDANGYSVFL